MQLPPRDLNGGLPCVACGLPPRAYAFGGVGPEMDARRRAGLGTEKGVISA